MIKFSLKYRIAVVIMTLEIVVMLLALGSTLKNYTESNRDQWAKTEQVQLNLLSELSRVALFTAEYDELQPYIEQAVADPHIVRVVLADRQNQVVVSSQVSDVGNMLPELVDTNERFWRAQEITNVSGRLGMLAINFSHAELLDANRNAKDLGFAIAASGIVLIAIVSLLIGHFLTRRLGTLTRAAQRFADGDLRAKSNLTGNDEVAVLGKTFDVMADNIQQHIDNLHATETALRQSRHNLERRVAERTAELAVARDQALEASRTKSTFLANMSHELRTPLNAVIGYSEMLAEDAKRGGYASIEPDLLKIKGAGMHLLSLINGVLDLSKIEAGKVTVEAESFEIPQFLKDCMTAVQPLATSNQNTLRLTCDAHIGTLHTDKMKLRQALINLLSNACKFTDSGDIDLRVQRTLVDGEDWVEFAVADTGIGIAPDQMSRLFSEFYQVDHSTTRKYGGTGLGLAISRRFCQMLGGEISVESSPERGSTFRIIVPANYRNVTGASPPDEHVAPATIADPRAVRIDPKKRPAHVATERRIHLPKVLVIDDDPVARELLTRYLTAEGYAIDRASSGKEGIDTARRLKPDIITLDVIMPDMNGWEVLQALKKDPETAHIPVVMLTMADERTLGFSLGAAHFLSKPLDRKLFNEVVTRILRKSD